VMSVWPPKQSQGQGERKDVEGPSERASKLINKVDSLNHSLSVEMDLYEFRDSIRNIIPTITEK
jgi:hypothetical protein